ncbi:hypothetical protein [Myroides odoratimimus]|uniref:hypothetical protein n=1 Tax=Myroides odoratimimus TaxID=76832 RepID=UPI00257823D4|nr:hypothetical protein [Myroides odoratimimus]MDM1413274.1 hypothetical protein [Myroides odoratimimus]MEC4005997.1 hypothetical protein [Myroides odoratimimus]
MEFIDKTGQANFHPHYIVFESHKWNAVKDHYGKYNFDGFSTTFKNTIKGLLIGEQNDLCCYCMKELEINDSSSIEHLYPNNPQPHNVFLSYSLMCIQKSQFSFGIRQIPTNNLDNLPHDISYYNLLACCTKCNNKRDNKEIRPFVFDINVNNEFSYDDEGNIFSLKYQDEITKIDLANDYYVNYRRLWKYIAKTNKTPLPSNINALKRVIIKASLGLYLNTKSVFYADFLKNGVKVNEAIKYIYFFY